MTPTPGSAPPSIRRTATHGHDHRRAPCGPSDRPATPPPIPAARPASAQRRRRQSRDHTADGAVAPIAPPTAPTMMAIDPPAASQHGAGHGHAGARHRPPACVDGEGLPAAADLSRAAGGAGAVRAAGDRRRRRVAFQAAPARRRCVLDVTPRGLGIGTVAGFCEELIRRNSRVPTETRKLFTTSRDSQDSVRIVVVPGRVAPARQQRRDRRSRASRTCRRARAARPRSRSRSRSTPPASSRSARATRRPAQEQRASLDLVGTLPAASIAARARAHRVASAAAR